MKPQGNLRLITLALALFTASALQAQHAHIAAGAESPTQGAKLFFVNGDSFVTNSGYVLYLNNQDPRYPGLYGNTAAFTSQPATLWTGGPAPNAAKPGAYLELEMVSVAGPSDGVVGVWQENEDAGTTTLKFSLPVGTTGSTNRFNLSEGVTQPELDPFGHIHGRIFTASKPGLYTIGVRIIDTSNAGVNGGPIHTPSDLFYLYFQAGLFISSISRTNNALTVQFGTQGYMSYYLEMNSSLGNTNWAMLAGPVGNRRSELLFLTDTNANSSPRFYRLRGLPQ
jgi:hypothetical protein